MTIKELVDRFKLYWMSILGAIILCAAYITFMYHLTTISLILTSITAIYDLVILLMRKKTISWWIHRIFRQGTDFVIGILVGGIMIKVIFDWGKVIRTDCVLGIMLGVVIGHLFWNTAG